MLLQDVPVSGRYGRDHVSCQTPAVAEKAGCYHTAASDSACRNTSLYFSSIGQYKLLTREEERHYARRLRNGEQQARDKLVLCNQRLVISQARYFRGAGLSLLELIAEGNLGLLQAIDNFEPGREVRLSTYAVPWIRQSMQRALISQQTTVRLPYRVACTVRKIKKITSGNDQTGSNMEQLGQQLQLDAGHLERAVAGLGLSRVSLEQAHDWAADSQQLQAGQNPGFCPYRNAMLASRRKMAEELLTVLRPVERQLLMLRFGLFDGREHSLEELAANHGLSREKVRRWLLDIMARLKQHLERQGIDAELLFKQDLH